MKFGGIDISNLALRLTVVGGFPIEKYLVKLDHSPSRGENKKIIETTIQPIFVSNVFPTKCGMISFIKRSG